MGKKNLRAGDEVVVIAGNDRGKIGKILSCTDERVVVEGINVRKKHMKRRAENQPGQIIDIECSIHVSNVKPCVDGRGIKLRTRMNGEGKRELFTAMAILKFFIAQLKGQRFKDEQIKEKYQEEIKPELLAKFNYRNPMMIPHLSKVVISMGLAEASKDKNALQEALNELTMLSGQRPLMTRSRKAIAGFKLREKQPIGAKVTLRGKRMYDFMDRFFNIVCPRIRDFRGFKLKGDGRGCYSLGVEDQQIFPEINLDLVKRTQGMNITFVTSAHTDEECIELLRQLGLPFEKAA